MGNQLFQYAALFGISRKTGYRIRFPKPEGNSTGSLKVISIREDFQPIEEYEYALGCFNVSAKQLSFWNRFRYTYNEPHFHFDPKIFNIKDGSDILGYFQSEKYFIHCADDIRNEFKIKDRFYFLAKERIKSFREHGKVLVSIHVRRAGHNDMHEHIPLPVSYYYAALKSFQDEYDNPNFLLFSDDLEWCRDNIILDNLSYAEGNPAIVDFSMMSMCDHHIIANSSFSWWAAWLGENPNKKVIAPRLWFGTKGDVSLHVQDLIPETWIKI